MIGDVADYFAKGCGRCPRFATAECSTRLWRDDLSALRRLCLDARLEETVKWGHPCYMHAGRNIAIIGAFRNDLRLSFFDAALMRDPNGALEKQGPNTAHKDALRFRSTGEVAAKAEIVAAYLREAMGYAAAGVRPERRAADLEPPAELVAALAADETLATAFDALTPGRKRSYVIALASAKKPETRSARIQKLREKILAGKGATER